MQPPPPAPGPSRRPSERRPAPTPPGKGTERRPVPAPPPPGKGTERRPVPAPPAAAGGKGTERRPAQATPKPAPAPDKGTRSRPAPAKAPEPPPKKGGGGGLVIGLLVALVLLGGGGAAVWFLVLKKAKPEPGSVRIESEPAGAGVFKDGAKLGDTPFDLALPGEHALEIRLDGFHEERVTIKVEEGKKDTVRVELRAKTGIVRLLGFKIGDKATLLDASGRQAAQRVVGPSGNVDLEARFGAYELVVERRAHEPARQKVEITDRPLEIGSLDFKEKPGTLGVKSDPAGAEIHLDGKAVGTTPAELADVPAGPHKVRLVHPDRSDWTGDVTVRGEHRSEITATLPALGMLEITTNPPGATVSGGVSGTTPLKASAKAGTVVVKIEHPEAGGVELEYAIEPGRATRGDIDLWDRKAKELEAAGRLREAIEAIKRSRTPDKAKIAELAKAIAAEAALEALRQALERGDAAAAYTAAIEVLKYFPDHAGAKEVLAKAKALEEKYSAALARGRRHVEAKEWKKALEAFAEAEAVRPGDEEARRGLAFVRVQLVEFLRELKGHKHYVFRVAFSPDGRTVASGSADNAAILWDVATGKERRLEGHAQSVFAVAFSPDGRLLATGSGDKTVIVWDAASGKEVKTLAGHAKQVRAVAFSPDGKRLASGGYDAVVKLWDVDAGTELKTLSGHAADVNDVAFSPDGKTIASASDDRSVKLWDAETGAERSSLGGHGKGVTSVAFSADGTLLASGSSDNSAKVWSVATGALARTFTGHAGRVSGVSLSADGRVLATGSEDYTVRLWEVASGTELKRLSGHASAVGGVAFHGGGWKLASGSDDKTVRIWGIPE